MPWARIPCDKLATIGLFGFQLEHQDGKNLWYRGPDGDVYCVDKYAPRFFFECVGDAMQAGCTAVRINSPKDSEELARFKEEAAKGCAEDDDGDEAAAG